MNAAMVSRTGACPACGELAQRAGRELWGRLAAWASAFDAAGGPAAALHRAAERFAGLMDVDRVSLLVPVAGKKLQVVGCSNRRHSGDVVVSLDLYPELVFVLDNGRSLVIPDVRAADLLRPVARLISGTPIRSLAAVPLELDDQRAIFRMTSNRRSLGTRDLIALEAAAHLLQHVAAGPERRRAEAAAAERLLAEVADVLIDVLPDGTITRVLGRPEEVLGRPAAALVGERLASLDRLARGQLGRLLESGGIPETLAGRLAADGPARVTVGDLEAWLALLPSLIPRYRVAVVGRGTRPPDTEDPGGATAATGAGEPAATGRSERERRLREALDRNLRALDAARLRVEELEEQKTRFLASAAHELKTPLTVLQSYLEILTTDLSRGMSEEQMSFIQTAYTNVLRLRKLVMDIVDLAALEGGEISLSIGRTAVVPLVRELVAEIEPLAAQAGLTIRVTAEPGLPDVRADAGRLGQILRNLLDNALKYTPAPGSIEVAVFREGDSVVIEVRDTGVGIPDAYLQKIFEPFFRVPRALEDRREGSGLGLAVTRRIIAAQGGRLSVSNRPEGGSAFRVSLPRWPECYVTPHDPDS